MHLSMQTIKPFFRSAGVIVVAVLVAACGALVTTPPPKQGSGSTTIAHPYPTAQSTNTPPIYTASLAATTTGWASGPTCTFANKGLTVKADGGQAYICLAPIAAITDFSATVTVHQLSGQANHAFGIAFRHAAPKNYYFFGIDGRGRFTVTIVTNDVGQTIIPFATNKAIHAGTAATNRLQVIMQGQAATFLVNDIPVGQATLTAFASGDVGLRGVNDGAIVFQELLITAV